MYTFKKAPTVSPAAIPQSEASIAISRVLNSTAAWGSTSDYKSWKTKEEKKEVSMTSFNDFPDLVTATESKKTIFEGMSLASRLKDVIAAEEEAAILKRLKKGETAESILRESCHIIKLKEKDLTQEAEEFVVPWWVTDTSKIDIIPPFQHRSLQEISDERRWKRLGIDVQETLRDEEIPDDISGPLEMEEEI